MKKIKFFIIVGLVSFAMANCVTNPIPLGLYGNYKGTINVMPGEIGEKEGRSCYTTFGAGGILPVLVLGDASVKTAASNGGVKKVSLVEFEQESFLLGSYSRTCIVVTGE